MYFCREKHVGPPTTNPQESWHKIAKTAKDRRPTDELLTTVFPQMLHQDGLRRAGLISHAPPDVRPGAQELAEMRPNKAFIIVDNEYWVKSDWTTGRKAEKAVTARWVNDVLRGQDGDISEQFWRPFKIITSASAGVLFRQPP